MAVQKQHFTIKITGLYSVARSILTDTQP